ncbi:MAG: hypothetical protein AB7P03_12660 [Kofleriaceae bacterium]
MAAPSPTTSSNKPTLRDRWSAHMAEYGRLAVWTYLVLSLSTIAGFSVAIGAGLQPSSASGVFGVIGAGWVAAKATMPIRILLTLALTPVVAAVIRRRRPTDRTPAELDA